MMRIYLLTLIAVTMFLTQGEAQYYRTVKKQASGGGVACTVQEAIFTETSLTTPWTADGSNATVGISWSVFYQGTTSIEVLNSNWSEFHTRRGGWSPALVSVAYDSLRFYARTLTGTATVYVKSYGSDYSQIGGTTSCALTTAWKQFAVPKQAGNAVWYFVFQIDAGTVYFDNIQLTLN